MVKRTQLDEAFLKDFDPHSDWLPPNTKPYDYTPEFGSTLERKYWRNCGLGRPAWYGADTTGTFLESSAAYRLVRLLLQVFFLAMKLPHETSQTSNRHSLVCFLSLKICPASTHLTFISECGMQHLHGMLKIWIYFR